MNRYDNRIDLDIYKCETTYCNDYKWYSPQQLNENHNLSIKLQPPCIVTSEEVKELPYQDHETLRHWKKNVFIPFNHLWKPRPIHDYNPQRERLLVAPPIIKNSTTDGTKSKRFPPKISISPAVVLDDSPRLKDLLLKTIYTSNWRINAEESALPAPIRTLPKTTLETHKDVKLEVDIIPELRDEMRTKIVQWEEDQLHKEVDPTERFWLENGPHIRGPLHNPFSGLVKEETKEEISKLIDEEQLRLPHDFPVPGYAGFQPRYFTGGLRKHEPDMTQPVLSVSQALAIRKM